MMPSLSSLVVTIALISVGSELIKVSAFTTTQLPQSVPSTRSSQLNALTVDTEIPYYAQISTKSEPVESLITPSLDLEKKSPSTNAIKKNKKNKTAGGGAVHKQGIFTPVVMLGKTVLGEDRLNKVRAKAISMHSDVISNFVDTHSTPAGQVALSTLYRIADTNGDGKLSTDEIETALGRLGFDWLKEKQINGIVKRADLDENGVIDWDEFLQAAPKTLRTNLIKLAKKNGGELGFLA